MKKLFCLWLMIILLGGGLLFGQQEEEILQDLWGRSLQGSDQSNYPYD